MGWFEGITKEVDIANRWHVQNEKNRLVPFSTFPFHQPSHQHGVMDNTAAEDGVGMEQRSIQIGEDPCQIESALRQRRREKSVNSDSLDQAGGGSGSDKWEDEPIGVRPPEWLLLSGDLVWTATFSTLTSNTVIEGPASVTSYMIFFVLTWHLWATQVDYDIRYYTNDWWHRFFFILQLTVYAALAGLSNNFNVWWGFNTGPALPFTGDDTTLTAEAITKNAELTLKESFQGVNIVLFISRVFLFLQYLRIIYYRRKSERISIGNFMIPGALFISALLFLICFLLITLLPMSRGVAITEVVLWFLSISVQIAGTILTPDEPKDTFRSFGSLSSRLSTLTVVVLGEGLNGICGTLRYSVNSLGFTGPAIANAVSIALILFFIWLLYFDGFKNRLLAERARRQLFLWLHLPFHLCLIVTFEGMKNWFLYTNFAEAIAKFRSALVSYEARHTPFATDAAFDAVLAKIGMSWNQEVSDFLTAVQQGRLTAELQYFRWVASVVYTIVLLYVSSPDPVGDYLYNQYMTNDTLVELDLSSLDGFSTGRATIYQFVDRYSEILGYPAYWVVAVAGVLLACIGTLNTIQLKPTDRYAWGSALNKEISGGFLLILGLTALGGRDALAVIHYPTFTMCLLPSMAIIYAAVALVNYVLLVLSVRSIRRQEAAAYGPAPVAAEKMQDTGQPSNDADDAIPNPDPYIHIDLSESQSSQGLPVSDAYPEPPVSEHAAPSLDPQILHQDELV